MYNNKPSEFEVQSLAFGILRKNLYPHYLVRGEYKFPAMRADIVIFRPTDSEPIPIVILEVKKSPDGTKTAQGERYESIVGCPCIYVRGYNDAYRVMELVAPYLK